VAHDAQDGASHYLVEEMAHDFQDGSLIPRLWLTCSCGLELSHQFQDGGSLFLVDKMADDVHGDGEDDGGILLGRYGIQRLKINIS
jgi:hypothetical protein